MSKIREYSSRHADLLADKNLKKESHSMVTNGNIKKNIIDAPKTTEPIFQHPLQSKSMFKPTVGSTILMYNKVGGTAQGEKLTEYSFKRYIRYFFY